MWDSPEAVYNAALKFTEEQILEGRRDKVPEGFLCMIYDGKFYYGGLNFVIERISFYSGDNRRFTYDKKADINRYRYTFTAEDTLTVCQAANYIYIRIESSQTLVCLKVNFKTGR